MVTFIQCMTQSVRGSSRLRCSGIDGIRRDVHRGVSGKCICRAAGTLELLICVTDLAYTLRVVCLGVLRELFMVLNE